MGGFFGVLKTTLSYTYASKFLKVLLLLNHIFNINGIVRSILHLPHKSSIRNWISSINTEPGFMMNVFREISKFPKSLRLCNLIFDSMAIWKQVLWDPISQKFVGFCEYDNGVSVEAAETEATKALVFMLASLRGTWKWVVGYFFLLIKYLCHGASRTCKIFYVTCF